MVWRVVVGALFGPVAYVATGFLLRGVDPAQPRFFSFPFSYIYPEYNLPCWMLACALIAWLLGQVPRSGADSGPG